MLFAMGDVSFTHSIKLAAFIDLIWKILVIMGGVNYCLFAKSFKYRHSDPIGRSM